MSASRSRAPSALAAILFILIGALAWFGQQLFASPPAPAEAPAGGAAWYELYFTDPDATAGQTDPSGGVPAAILTSLAGAQRSLDLAVYEIDLDAFAQALIAAQQRGVRVRVVTDSDYRAEPPAAALRAAGIPVAEDGREAFMHNKFVVIDGAAVWTGSMNFTFSDAYRNNNNMLFIRSTRLAENYTAQFERMFSDQVFDTAAAPPYPALNLSGTLVETYFSPNGGAAAKVLDVLNTAQSSIYFMAFSFTRSDFADALVAKARAGLTVRGVLERRQVLAGADSAWLAFQAADLPVRLDGNPYNLHSKVFIVDEQIVVTGSYNFSRNAEENNSENVLILHNAEIAQAYLQEWRKVWAKAGE